MREKLNTYAVTATRALTFAAPLLLALSLIAIAASAARADVFACVNNSSGTPKIVSSCTPGTNASPCHHNDTCVVLSAAGTTLQRLVADFQNTTSIGVPDEISTIAPPTATPVNPSTTPVTSGGNLAYTKSVSIPFPVTYITFSAQGDGHSGTALLMQATVTDSSGNTTICQPLSGQTGPGGGGANLFPQWYTLLHLPDAGTAVANCNDGGGGSADCHDNTISFTCCALVTPDSGASTHSVNIGLASSTGGTVFYERSTIYVDGSPNPGGNLCAGHGVP
jgi:hypothetical protein